MYHVWSLLCRRAIIDSKTGLLSIIDVIETVHLAEQPPFVLPPFVLMSKWNCMKTESRESDFAVKIFMKGPSDKKRKRVQEIPVHFPANGRGANLQLEINSMSVTKPGEWLFIISSKTAGGKWKDAAVLPLSVNLMSSKNVTLH